MKASIKTLQNANASLKAETKSFSGAFSLIRSYYMKEDKIMAKRIFPEKYSKEWEQKVCEFLSEKEQKPTKNNPYGLSRKQLYLNSEKYKQELISEEFMAHSQYEIWEKEMDEEERGKLEKKITNEIFEGAVYKDFLKNKRFNFSPYGVGMLAHAMYNTTNGFKK